MATMRFKVVLHCCCLDGNNVEVEKTHIEYISAADAAAADAAADAAAEDAAAADAAAAAAAADAAAADAAVEDSNGRMPSPGASGDLGAVAKGTKRRDSAGACSGTKRRRRNLAAGRKNASQYVDFVMPSSILLKTVTSEERAMCFSVHGVVILLCSVRENIELPELWDPLDAGGSYVPFTTKSMSDMILTETTGPSLDKPDERKRFVDALVSVGLLESCEDRLRMSIMGKAFLLQLHAFIAERREERSFTPKIHDVVRICAVAPPIDEDKRRKPCKCVDMYAECVASTMHRRVRHVLLLSHYEQYLDWPVFRGRISIDNETNMVYVERRAYDSFVNEFQALLSQFVEVAVKFEGGN